MTDLLELYFLGALLLAAVISLLLTPLARRLALACGFIDRPGARKIHVLPVAYGGGLAVALATALTFALAFLLRRWGLIPIGSSLEDLRGRPLLCVAIAAFGMLVLGLIDDKFKLSARTKLIVQLALATFVVAGGVRVTAFVGDNLLMQALTVCWIVLVTNSFNLLDNMDGLCSGVASISAAMLALVAMESQQWNLMFSLAALSGACVGFLKYNRAPASIFLGDTGSLFCGFMMACATGSVTYYHANKSGHLAVGIPLLILAIPLYDTLSVICIRLKEGRPIMRGDTSHFSHRLVDLGMSRRQAVTVIQLACLAIGLPAVVLGSLSLERGLLVVGQGLLVLTLIALLENAGRQRALKCREADSLPAQRDEGEMHHGRKQ